MFYGIRRLIFALILVALLGKTWVHIHAVEEIDSMMTGVTKSPPSTLGFLTSLVAVAGIVVMEIKFGAFLAPLVRCFYKVVTDPPVKDREDDRGENSGADPSGRVLPDTQHVEQEADEQTT